MANTSSKGLSALVVLQQKQPFIQIIKTAVVNPLLPTPPSTPVVGATGDATAAFWQVATAASIGLSAFHGYKRNNGSIGWGIGWGLLGGIFPILTPAIAVAEGFGKPVGR